jgi:hypothetical protein
MSESQLLSFRPSVFRITDCNNRVLGTAFLVSDQGLAFTCFHVVKDLVESHSRLLLHSHIQESLNFSIEWYDDAVDAALIHIDRLDSVRHSPLPLDIRCRLGDNIFTTGFQNGTDQPDPATGSLSGDVLVNGIRRITLYDCKAIGPGLSGAPAWSQRLERVIGIIDSGKVDGYGNAALLVTPTAAVLASLQSSANSHRWSFSVTIPGWNFGNSRPNLPRLYQPRELLLNRLSQNLHNLSSSTGSPVCILVGESGCGKTLLARSYIDRHLRSTTAGFTWFDCQDAHLQDPPEAIYDPTCLVVFDGVTPDHPLITENWLNSSNCSAIITTDDNDAAATMARIVGFGRPKDDVIINVPVFSEDEGISFLHALDVEHLSDYHIRVLFHLAAGSPLVLQAIADLVVNDLESEVLTEDIYRKDPDKLAEAILSRWLELRGSSETSSVVLALSNICFRGMSFMALSFVLSLSVAKVIEATQPLIDRGFVRVFRSTRFPNDALLILHDSLHSLLPNSANSADTEGRLKRYYSLLEYDSDDGKQMLPPLTALDCWIVGFQQIFPDEPLPWELFDPMMSHHVDLLQSILPRHITRHESKVLSKVFGSRLQPGGPHAREMRCDQLLALAFAVSRLPFSFALGDMIWLGARHDDSWARAACIRSATIHWRHLAPDLKQERAKHLFDWVTSFYYPCASSGSCISHDWDVAAAIGGLFLMGFGWRATDEILCHPKFIRARPMTLLSDLVCIICLADGEKARVKPGNVPVYTETQEFLRCNWSRANESAIKDLVRDYLRTEHGIDCSSYGRGATQSLVREGIDLAMTLAQATHSDGFRNFAKSRGVSNFSAYDPQPDKSSLWAENG